jgi:EAL domain-containing protein (putative c-di-GMP-specific phosphodiesterase class I)/PAS domain-containing protein
VTDNGRTELQQTRGVVTSAVAVLSASMVVALVSYCWDWWDAINEGGIPEPDEWLGLVGVAWLPLAALVTVRLVRLQRLLARRAREAVAAFEDTVHTAHGWVWQADTGMRLTYSSDGAGVLLGRGAEQLVGQDVRRVVGADDEMTAGAHDWLTQAWHEDGSVRHLSSTVASVRDDAGRVVAYRGFTADVTAETIAATAEAERHGRHEAARARIEHAMRDPDALRVLLQPIADLDRQRIAGMEALARFAGEPSRPPNLWFAEAWEVGLGADLELYAVELAIRRLPELPPHAYLAVNVSAQTLLDERLLDLLTAVGEDRRRIVVEVTEHAAIDDYDALDDVLRRLRAMGARLAVDDAGAGYASMQHILRLRPDIIKLDRSIVADSDLDPARFALIGAMASFGASLGMTVVAEGVETPGELEVLTDNRITHAQGYYLARPAADPAPLVLGAEAPAIA